MVILMKQNCTKENVQEVVKTLKKCGLGADVSEGTQATIIGILGDKSKLGGWISPYWTALKTVCRLCTLINLQAVICVQTDALCT